MMPLSNIISSVDFIVNKENLPPNHKYTCYLFGFVSNIFVPLLLVLLFRFQCFTFILKWVFFPLCLFCDLLFFTLFFSQSCNCVPHPNMLHLGVHVSPTSSFISNWCAPPFVFTSPVFPESSVCLF